MTRYYDRDGATIDVRVWATLFEDKEYRRVVQTTVVDAADPAKTYDVSTIWLGLDHNWGSGAPLIFETMVFGDGADDMAIDRYSTEALAREGHTATVVSVCATLTDPVVTEAGDRAGLRTSPVEAAPVDAIEADVRERMRGGEPRTGYDFGDPTFPHCPHPWCDEQWHGLAITHRMWEMRHAGEVDPDYRYGGDDSEVLCPGSLFEGEFEPPKPMAPTRPSRQGAFAATLGWATSRQHVVARPLIDPVNSLADAVLAPPDPGMPWWRCDRYVELWFAVSERVPETAYWRGGSDEGEMVVRAILNTGGPLEFRSVHGDADPRPREVAVRWPQPPPVGHWQPWEPGPLILGDTFTALTRISRVAACTTELPAEGLREAKQMLKEHFVRDVRAELHIDIDIDDVELNESPPDRLTLIRRHTALWRPAGDDIELYGGGLRRGYVVREAVAADVVMLGSGPVQGPMYGRAGWNMDTRRWVYLPINPDASRPAFIVV